GAEQILALRAQLEPFAERFAERARNHDRNLSAARAQALRDQVLARARSLLDDWSNIAAEFQKQSTHLQYQQETGAAQLLLYEFLHPEVDTLPLIRRRFRANRSMRDVERSVEISVKNLNDWGSP